MAEGADRISDDQVVIEYAGRSADSGELFLEEYAASLNGWRDFFNTAGDAYLRSSPELRDVPRSDLLELRVGSERRGSYQVWIAFLLGAAVTRIIANRADAAVLWSFRKMLRWYRDLAKTFVSVKRQTTDIEAVARALEQVASGYDVSLAHAPRPVDDADQLRLVPDNDDDEAAVEPVNPSSKSVRPCATIVR